MQTAYKAEVYNRFNQQVVEHNENEPTAIKTGRVEIFRLVESAEKAYQRNWEKGSKDWWLVRSDTQLYEYRVLQEHNNENPETHENAEILT